MIIGQLRNYVDLLLGIPEVFEYMLTFFSISDKLQEREDSFTVF